MPQRLTVPVNFVSPTARGLPALLSVDASDLTDDLITRKFTYVGSGWVVKTYAYLARAGEKVTLSEQPVPGRINLAEPRHFGARKWNPHIFTVSTRGDAHRSFLAHYWIEQNEVRQLGNHQSSINYWGQPGILPRDPARGSRIETLHFKGRERNLAPVFRSESFINALSARGVTLTTGTTDEIPTEFYRDYRGVDLVFGVRNLTVHDAKGKPPNKLLNSWTAGVPALMGPEPAFQALRRKDTDYIEVRDVDSILHAVDRLKSAPERYQAMIRNGLDRSEEYSNEHTLARWIDMLNGPVNDVWESWKAGSSAGKVLGSPFRMAGEKLSKRYYLFRARHGRRILD